MTTPEEKQAEVRLLLNDWFAAAKESKEAAAKESAARLLLVNTAFPKLKEGAGNVLPIGFGKNLKVTGKINRKLDEALLALAKNIPAEIIEAVIKMKPSLIVGAFKSLSDDDKKLFGDIVTETPGAPSVEIVDQKKAATS